MYYVALPVQHRLLWKFAETRVTTYTMVLLRPVNRKELSIGSKGLLFVH